MKLVFVTQMLKYGCTESHHYVLGVYSTKAEAELAGEVERLGADTPMSQMSLKWSLTNRCPV